MRGMFRIYKCYKCMNTGYSKVESEEDESECSLCGAKIYHEKGTLYAVTTSEAKEFVMDLVMESSVYREKKLKRGLGMKKRVYNIVESLIEMNRGRPVQTNKIMRECSDASIPLERAQHFLNVLRNEGLVTDTSEGFMIEGGVS